MTELDDARYISLTTFKRDGAPVSTPVWVTGSQGRYSFTTGDLAWKTRRLLHNPAVLVQRCDMRGRTTSSAVRYTGTGEVLRSLDAVHDTQRALAAKYGWQFRATKWVDSLKNVLGRGQPQRVVAIRLTIDQS